MRKVITYGTYDLLHEGHLNLLRKAKNLGDYLIVGVTSDSFDINRGKLNVRNNLLARVQAVKETGLADEIIVEDYVGQKIDDIQKHEVDIFAIGSDWQQQFDYLKEFCNVIYIPRTEGISSTILRNKTQRILRMGVVGAGRVASKFIPESTYVNGVHVVSVFDIDVKAGKKFQQTHELEEFYSDYKLFLESVDAVYIATPHLSHYHYSKHALLMGKHVLCEIPLTLEVSQAEDLFLTANNLGLALLEASKTAFCPAFLRLVSLVKSGIIGRVISVRASISKLVSRDLREFDSLQAGGSMTELSPLALMAMIKLLGIDIIDQHLSVIMDDGVDTFVKGDFYYEDSIASIMLGLGVKTEGDMVISGTKGYAYVPAPWWKTDFFEIRYEDQNQNKKFFYPYDGHGLRYEIQEFTSMICSDRKSTFKLLPHESIRITQIIESFKKGKNLRILRNR